jgi:hypothetical protein
MHLKSSDDKRAALGDDKRAALGLYRLKLLIFLELCFLRTCVPVGLLLTVRVVFLDLVVVERLCTVGVDLAG